MRVRCLFTSLMFISCPIYADQGDINLGVGIGTANVEFIEPEFSSKAELINYPLANASWDYTKIHRIELTWRHIDSSIGGGSNAKPNTNGLTVSGDQISLEWLYNVRLHRHFKPWIGLGMVINQYAVTDKFSTDEDGYAQNVYADRDDTSYAFSLVASIDYEILNNVIISPQIGYDIALDEGPEGPRVAIFAKYRFSFN